MGSLLQDVRYGFRVLRKNLGFTIVAVLTLAVGIGSTVGTFTVVNSVLLRPFPFAEPEQLVRLYESNPQTPTFSLSGPNYLDWKAQSQAFESMGAWSGGQVALLERGEPEQLAAAAVTSSLFPMLRVEPQRGRAFTAEEDRPGASANVAVISAGLWERRFGSDPSVLGRSLNLAGQSVTVVGIMPKDYNFPVNTDIWVPLAVNPDNRGNHIYGAMGRLKPGVTPEQARTELGAIAALLAQEYPATNKDWGATVMTLTEWIIGPQLERTLLVMMGAVFFVLLIACANVANLLLVRASVRSREMAVRAALGAGRVRLGLQMLAESLVLAVGGGLGGVLLGYAMISPIRTLAGTSLPRVADITLDVRVLLFAAAAALLTGLIFGLAPAWHATRPTVGACLREGGRSSAARGTRWLRHALLIGEVAISIVLLAGATLLVRSFLNVYRVDPGFNPEPVMAFQVGLPQPVYPTEPSRLAFYDGLIEKLEAEPGVASASIIQTLPMRGDYQLSFDVRGRAPARPGEGFSANYRVVAPHYFETLGIPLKRGRAFGSGDTGESQKVVIIDEAFARQQFPDRDPIGQAITIGNGRNEAQEIVGVVGNVHHLGLETAAGASMYVPLSQDVFSGVWVVARAKGDPSALFPVARQAVRDLNPNIPPYAFTTMAAVVTESQAGREFSLFLLVTFAGVALFLAAVGLYGVVGYAVLQRTREIGLRIAIGAEPTSVLWMILGGGMKLALAGVAIGVVAALGLGRVIKSMLFNVEPRDPVSLAATAAVLVGVALLACYIPARRAMRVDPIVAIREE